MSNTSDLEGLDEETGKPPATRFKDAGAVRSTYLNLKHADRDAAFNRAAVQMMFDGEPPYDENQLKAAGQGYRCNMNFGEAEDLLARSLTNYLDMIESIKVLVSGKTKWGGDQDIQLRDQYSEIIMEELSKMFRLWPAFIPRYLLNATYYLQHGVSFTPFPDAHDWRNDVCRLGDFQIPRDTHASEDELEVAFRRVKMPVHKLWNKIQNKTAAAARGWDVDCVKRTLQRATNESATHSTTTPNDWEEWQTEAKNNDLGLSAGTTSLDLVHCWVREFSGKVSHYIISTEGDAQGNDENAEDKYLFADVDRYDDMSNAFTAFTYGVGTNGHFHGIRGLGYKIFPHIQTSDRLNCQTIDGAMLAGSVQIQPNDINDMNRLMMSYMGPYTVISPGVKVLPTSTPNFSQNVLPVLGNMRQMLRQKTGGYTATDALPDDKDMSRFEAASRIQTAAGLTQTNMVLHYLPLDRLYREMSRRALRKGYIKDQPGGDMVVVMRQAIRDRGVPDEAVDQFDFDSIRAVRATGSGSEASRDETYRELTDLSAAFDEQGRIALMRKRVASKVGWEGVDEFIQAPEETRVPIDAKIAEMENNQIFAGFPVEVLGSELHFTHLEKHAEKINEVIEAVDQGQAELTEVVESLIGIHAHAGDHLSLVQGNTVMQESVAMYRQILQQSDEKIMNGIRALEKIRRDQGEIGEDQQGNPEEDEHTAKMRREFENHQLKMQMVEQEFVLKSQLAVQEADTKRAIASADAAAKLSPSRML